MNSRKLNPVIYPIFSNRLVGAPVRRKKWPITSIFSRSFRHASPRYLVNETLQLSYSCFDTLHGGTGLLWALSIPLTGILFRLSFMPVQYYMTRRQQRVQAYVPLMVGWRSLYRKQAALRFPPNTPDAPVKAEQGVRIQLVKKQKSFEAKYGKNSLLLNLSLSLSFLPVWVVNLDVLRRMAGVENTVLTASGGTIPVEPTFSSEGALWFSDLTAADPTLILPIAFGAAQVANWYFSGGNKVNEREKEARAMPAGSAKARAVIHVRLYRLLLLVTAASGPICIIAQVPSGVMLYLLSSAVTMLLQRPILKRILKIEEPIKPARSLVAQAKTQT